MEFGVRKSVGSSRWVLIPAIAGLSVALTACGGSSKKAEPPKSAAPTAAAKSAAATVAPEPKFTKVIVTATDFKFAMSVKKYTAGNYTFSLKNSGKAKHALRINGPGLDKQTSAVVTAGQTTDLVVPLKKGTYTFSSPVGNDKAKGMSGTILVS